MTDCGHVERLVRDHLDDPESSFSMGSLGAIAEFHRDRDEPAIRDGPIVVTARGAIRVVRDGRVVARAYESPSSHRSRWRHGVVLCLPEACAAGAVRSALTEIGPDRDAVREQDRGAVLFDMGLGARNVDFCIRTADETLIRLLRAHAGRSVLEPGSRVMPALLDASPHRIAITRLGRIEVYQPIGRVRTPEGPHTHVLPKLLASGRTHTTAIPVPEGHLPCLDLYPAHPALGPDGRDKPFDAKAHAAFQALLAVWGAAAHRHEKERALRAISDETPPGAYEPPDTRMGRAALRVALRQLRAAGERDSPVLRSWAERFDPDRPR